MLHVASFVKVHDACSAPGNKTINIAALMKGQGQIMARELHQERVKRLELTIKLAWCYQYPSLALFHVYIYQNLFDGFVPCYLNLHGIEEQIS